MMKATVGDTHSWSALVVLGDCEEALHECSRVFWEIPSFFLPLLDVSSMHGPQRSLIICTGPCEAAIDGWHVSQSTDVTSRFGHIDEDPLRIRHFHLRHSPQLLK